MKKAIIKATESLGKSLPLILGTILLISLLTTIVPESFYTKFFNKNLIFDSFLGAIIGSISAGTPIISYILGGEMLKQGISLIAVTAFLVAWVTVGFIQLPAESITLGKRFAIWRNLSAFVLSIIVAFTTVLILNLV
jgi:uncharacterized membrane protein YraQ (UPF0718 family)